MTQIANVTGIIVTPLVGVIAAIASTVNEFQKLLYRTDLANVFMNSEEFAISISYTHSSTGEIANYDVVYDDPSTSVKVGQGPAFKSLQPQFMISEAELSHPILKRDTCVVNGIDYGIEDFDSDGVGVTTVFLRRLLS